MTRERAGQLARSVSAAMGEPRLVVLKECGDYAICSPAMHAAAVNAGAVLEVIEMVEP